MNDAENPNIVELTPEGYLDVRLIGDQTYRSIDATGKQCERIIEKLRFEHKPVLGIIDFTQEKGFNTGSNKAAMQVLDRVAYDKAALVGDNKVLVEVGDLIVKALGKNDSTKIFDAREAAVAWLLMKDPLAG